MSIPAGIKTPGVYTDVNINTLRTGLPANEQKFFCDARCFVRAIHPS